MTELDRRSFLASTAGALTVLGLMPETLPKAPAAVAGRKGLPVAIIGAGRQGRAIIGELQKMDAVRIAALCDIDRSRLDSGLRRIQGAEGFDDYRRLLDTQKDIQAVFIATPTHLHKDIAADALAAGKHIYCEAPLAHTIEDCRAIARAARSAARTVFHSGMEGRSNPVYALARTFFRSDSVRDLIWMRAQQQQKTTWRTPASDPARDRALNWRLDPEVSIGLPGEWGTHQFDVVHWYTGAYPTSIRGSGSIRLHDDGREIPDTTHCELAFGGAGGAGGARLLHTASLGCSYEGKHEVFHGSNATIKLAWSHGWMFKEADAPTQGWEVYANRQQFHNDEGITLIAEATSLAAQGKLKEGVGLPHPSLYYALADFLKSVLEDRPIVCTAEEGCRASIIGILAHQAVTTGDTITIDPEMLRTI